jgi:hypothetical protein
MSLHLYRPITVRPHLTLQRTIIALPEASFGKRARENGFLAVNIAIIILLKLISFWFGDASPVGIRDELI